MNRYEWFLVAILRVAAAIVLLSIPTIFLPEAWMEATHKWLGLGEMPKSPIVWYLSRSLSAMYAILGCFTWLIASDVRRYVAFVRLWGWIHIVFGAVMIPVDFWAKLPLSWTLTEGPPLILGGVLVLWLLRKSGI